MTPELAMTLQSLVWSIVPALLWAFIAWRRIYRLLRFFQLEEYDSRRYLRWLVRQRYELLYVVANFLNGLLFLILYAGWWIDEDSAFGFVLEVLAHLSAVLHLVFLPRERQAKQTFTPTSRAVRLLITAATVNLVFALGLVELILIPIAGTTRFADAMPGLFWSLYFDWALVAGIIAVLLAPFSLPLANIINWPIEEAFRRYYLRLAKQRLKRSGATVIGITGSYGKTSTKHYLNHILSARYRVLMTPKSYNTLLGISRVINEILSNDASYDYFIVEAGAYIPGEIARICKLVEPQISMVTTVGPMHLERFGNIENVVKAKYEIIEALPPDGVAVFNADDPLVRGMADRSYPHNRILVSRQGAPDARLAATNIRMTADGLDFDVCDKQTNEQRTMHAPLYGEHNVTNILMAMGVARHLGMSLPEIAMRVATLEPAEHRLVRHAMPDGTVLIDDAYSANPVGTQTALDVLALQKSQPGARRIVVSSGMFELGPLHEEENRKLGERIAATATDAILIGAAQTKPVQEGLAAASFPPEHLHVVSTLNEAVEIYRSLLRPGDALLILTDLPDTYT
jgi:UDP-N-acetylmuramoyl-tripeptide--D-alanyl-D-alanine ligase